MRVLRCGEHAMLVELDDLAQVHGLYQQLRGDPPEGVVELVPAARTVLVGYDPMRVDFSQLAGEISGVSFSVTDASGGADVEIPVRYDGADLAYVARLAGISERDVVERHTAVRYTSGFCGFAPGFAYLTGLDPSLQVDRRDTPRVRVPAGAVALADEFTAVYPRESPGGWRIIGHTDVPVWDLSRDPPTLLTPGTRVRFVEAER
jgi:KipI family sensor histidine kinase inhibitor